MNKRFYMMAATVFAIVALLVGTTAAVRTYADAPVDGRAGRAEVRFLEGMMDHHQMAIDMANDCLKKAKTASVVTMCQNIIKAQTAEITQMSGYLLAWYNVQYMPMSMMDMPQDSMTGMDHSGMGGPNVDPVMMMGMMAGLGRLEGVDYEIAWLESMTDHHDDALHMSERILKQTEGTGHAQLRELAQKIFKDQTAEITEMEAMIKTLAK